MKNFAILIYTRQPRRPELNFAIQLDETSYVYDYDSDGRLLNVYVNGKLQEEYT